MICGDQLAPLREDLRMWWTTLGRASQIAHVDFRNRSDSAKSGQSGIT